VTAGLLTQLQEALGHAYRVEQELPGGGMSRLFRATEASLGRQVVIKVLPPEMSGSVSARRFQREIELTAHLQHPHILPVLAAGAKDGILYYVMPFVAGESLRHRLVREGKLPVADACRMLREMADALAFAHAEGIVHRDMKPENILLQGSHAVLADFGVAGALEAAQGGAPEGPPGIRTQLTGTGTSVGTPSYMAPEQLAADATVDGRSDLYALGVIGYEMLAGERPFAGLAGPQLLVARLTETPEPLHWVRPEVSEELSAVIARAMARDPEDRFQWATEMHDAIEAASPRVSATASRMSAPAAAVSEPPAPPRSVRRLLARVAVVAAIALLAAGAIYAWRIIAAAADLQDDLIAVAPFEAYDPEIKQIWSEGVVDILSRNLDGMGPLRTVSPAVIVRQWPAGARAGEDAAVELGRRTGAQYVLIGLIVGEGDDSVTITSSIVATATGGTIAATERRIVGPLNRMTMLTDSITVSVLRGLGQSGAVASIRGSDLGTRSLAALKSFLQGEYFYRRAQWDSARTHYERAITQDTTFALAFHRAGMVNSWQRSGVDSLTRVFYLRAGRHNTGLPLRDSLLIVADSLSAVIGYVEGNPNYLPQARALFATLRAAVERYPNDPEVWYALGEAQHHYGYGPVVGLSTRRTLESFDRAIALDSAFAPAYIHAVELGLTLDGAARALPYATKYAALRPTDAKGAGVGLTALLAEDPTSPATRTALDTASIDVLRDAWFIIRRWSDERETAVQVARTWLARALAIDERLAGLPRTALVSQLAYRGKMAEAYELWGARPSRLYAELTMAGAVPPANAATELRSWVAGDNAFAALALPYLAEREDTATLAAYERAARRRAAERNSATGARPGYDAAIAGAYLHLARRDTAAAVAAFTAIPDTLCLGCALDRLVEGRLLSAVGRHGEAASILDERLPTLLSPTEVVFQIELAAALKASGSNELFQEACASAVRLWRRADPNQLRHVAAVCGTGRSSPSEVGPATSSLLDAASGTP
jgi:serine/threonine-protein kinase